LISIPQDSPASAKSLIYDQILSPIIRLSVDTSKVFTAKIENLPPCQQRTEARKRGEVFDPALKHDVLCQMENFSHMGGRQLLLGKLMLHSGLGKSCDTYHYSGFQSPDYRIDVAVFCGVSDVDPGL
jgi:hypothetical protein